MAGQERSQRNAGIGVEAELRDVGFSDAEVVGIGSLGIVFRCHQISHDRTVAVKVLTEELDSEKLHRFLWDERALAKVSTHPNVVTVFDAGTTHTGRPFVVMEYLPGNSLDGRIAERGPLSWEQVLGLGVKISGALEIVHRQGIIHRDVKPANVLFTGPGEPQLTDFGIARFSGAFEMSSDVVTGSPAYIAPEVLAGNGIGTKSDVYSLAATLFCALAGHAAFARCDGEHIVTQFLRMSTEPIPDLRERNVPAEVCGPIESAMSRDPGERPATAAEFGELLRAAEVKLGRTPDKMTVSPRQETRISDSPTKQYDEVDCQLQLDERSSIQTHAQPDVKKRPAPPGNLPIELTSFVGRRRQIIEVRESLSTSRLVTLIGAGGVGKTRLALRAASAARRTFADGIWFAELSQVREPAVVPNAVASSIAVLGRSLRAPADQLVEHFRDRRALLVLDNCEHVLDAVAALTESLLRACHHLKVLTTSREPLGVGAEDILRVPPLSIPDRRPVCEKGSLQTYESTQLFVERASAAVPGFEITDENWDSIVQICKKLDGLPLSIELAAVRMRAMGEQEILTRLTDRFRLLTISNRGAPSRQQTLRLSVDWSYELCSPEEQKLWSRLSVFAGGFELDAAEAVCGPDCETGELLDVVASLVDKSILIREEAALVVRYRLLDTLRDYGREKLCIAEECDHFTLRHEQWYRDYTRRAEAEWIGPRQLEWVSRLRREQANLRVVLGDDISRTDYEDGLHLALALYPFWLASGQISEGRSWFEQLILGSRPSTTRTKALYLTSVFAGLQGDISGESELMERAQSDDRDDESTTCAVAGYARGWMCLVRDKPTEARDMFEDAIAASPSQGRYLFQRIASLFGVSLASVLMGDAERAINCHNEILSIAAQQGECIHPGRSAWTAGMALRQLHRLNQAKTVLKEGLGFARLANDPLGTARSMQALAWIAQDEHEDARAATLIGATETQWHNLGGPTVAFQSLREQQSECERRASAALGTRKYAAAIHRGRAFGFTEAIEYAVGTGTSAVREEAVAGLAGLTRRENEVARLIAQGLTNSSIASRLVISPRTAQGHVENILTKLSFTSRTQIAAWVVDQSQSGS